LPTPENFEEAAVNVREEDVAELVVCGPDAEQHLAAIREFEVAGFDHVHVHQVGPDQDGFFRFYEREVLPRVAQEALTATG
jgi:coenzyme F420-dependent glucose-6-phosphate dehydrogenase